MLLSRKKMAMIAAEFLGTGVLTLVVLAISRSSIGLPFFVALGAGLAVAGMTLAFGVVSGAHFNPAITIGLWSARRIKTLPAIVYVAAQLLGGAAAYLLFSYFIDQTWHNTGKFDGKMLVTEAVGAFIFSMGWAAAAYHRWESGKAASVLGMAFALGLIATSITTMSSLNPAVAMGARTWVWGTTVLGPVLGAIIGFNLYGLLFAPEGELMAPFKTKRSMAAAPVAAKLEKAEKKAKK